MFKIYLKDQPKLKNKAIKHGSLESAKWLIRFTETATIFLRIKPLLLTLHETVVESGAIAGVKGQAIEVHSAVTFISLASSLLHLLD